MRHLKQFVALFFVLAGAIAQAQVPQAMSYQAYLTDAAGVPIDGPVSITFTIYTAAVGGTPSWTETRSLAVESGLLAVELGGPGAPFPPSLFDTPLWIGVTVGTDGEMTPRRPLTTAAFSFTADDALTLQGQGPAAFDQAAIAANLDARLSAVEANEILPLLNLVAGTDIVDVDGRIAVRSANSGALTIEKAPGAGSGNPTEVFFNQAPTDGPGQYGTVGYDDSKVFLDIAGGQDEFSVNSVGQAEIVGPADPRLTIRTSANDRGALYLGDQNHGIRRGATAPNDVLLHTDSGDLFLSAAGRDNTNQFVLENDGSVGIGMGSTTPRAKLQVEGGSDANFSADSGYVIVGSVTGSNLVIDGNEIIARNNGNASTLYLNDTGFVEVPVLRIVGGADIVEGFETVDGDHADAGTVMVIDLNQPGKLRSSDTAYDSKVAGVVSGAAGIEPGIRLGQKGVLDGDLPVAMSGRVYVKCTTENGPIRPGDRLTTASLAGHAMRVTDRDRADGAVIGKSMSSLNEGTGLVLVLVNLQ